MQIFRPHLPGLTALIVLLGLPCAATTVPFLPDFAAATFVSGAPIDNPYLPHRAGDSQFFRATGTDPDGNPIDERFALTFKDTGPAILGVDTRTQVDKAYESGLLVEETFDYFAQDTEGNVWYMGEDVTNYVYDDTGVLTGTNTSSSWRAGVNSALPGFAMPAHPIEGFSYYQEFAAADGALDEGLILGFLDTLLVGGVTYSDVLRVFETSALDPLLREVKYYAPGVGFIRADEGVDASYGNPVLVLERVAPVPLPAALPLLAGAVGLLCALARRRRAAAC